MSSDALTEIIDSLKELKRMHQLNYELLEQLNVACGYFLENHVKMPNEDKIVSLLSKAMTLLKEIDMEMPSDDFLQRKKPDGDLTEPPSAILINT
jgi:hypothetical protein